MGNIADIIDFVCEFFENVLWRLSNIPNGVVAAWFLFIIFLNFGLKCADLNLGQ